MCDFYLFLTNVKESVLEMCGSLAFPTCIERKLIIFITKSRQIIPLTIHLYSFFSLFDRLLFRFGFRNQSVFWFQLGLYDWLVPLLSLPFFLILEISFCICCNISFLFLTLSYPILQLATPSMVNNIITIEFSEFKS